MNIYEKIIQTTLELQNTKIKKSGENKYAGFKYFELRDIAPEINKLCAKYKILINIKYDDQKATMDLIDAEKPENKVTYTSPMGSINLKGAHEIQNLGAIQTYLRRYFYLTAFNIAENDEFDSMKGNPQYEKDIAIRELMSLYKNFVGGKSFKPDSIIEKIKKKDINQINFEKERLISEIKRRNEKIINLD